MTRLRRLAQDMTTDELYAAVVANAEIQKRNPMDSHESTRARVRNRPFMAELATRPDAPPVR